MNRTLPDGRFVRVDAKPRPGGGLIVTYTDITELHRRKLALEDANQQIALAAFHDALTGLPNRRFAERTLADLKQKGRALGALIHVDLDHFKQINDELGHAAGDEVLRHVARTLNAQKRPTDTAARMGGDEFVILCTAPADDAEILDVAARVVAALQAPLTIGDEPARFGASAGVAFPAHPGEDPSTLLLHADLALYRAKRLGRGRVERFTPQLSREAARRTGLSQELRRAVQREEFTPLFQPQVDAASLEIVGVEALARWRRSDGVLTPPAEFLHAAEELELIDKIDRLIAERAAAALRELRARGRPAPQLSVNASLRRVLEPDLLDTVAAHDADAVGLAVELPESALLDERFEPLTHRADALRERGARLVIDAFGGGAAIARLARLGPDRLKSTAASSRPASVARRSGGWPKR